MLLDGRLRGFGLGFGILLGLPVACSEGEGGDRPTDGIVEGDTGLFYRPGVECFSWNARPRAGSDIWVSPEGSDSNEGIGRDAPLATLAEALCHAAPGQTVHVLPGTYSETVILGQFGDGSAPIAIIGEAEGGRRPILDGEGRLTMGLGIAGTGMEALARRFLVENLEFRNYTDQGLLVTLAESVTVRNCRFEGNGFHSITPDAEGEGFSLLVTSSTQVALLDNEALRSGPEPGLLEQGLLGTAINTWGMSDSRIQGNRCHHNIGCGILVEEGIRVEVRGNEIDHSRLHSEYLDGGIWLDGGHHVTVTDNYIHDNEGAAIQVSDTELNFPYASCRYVVTDNRIEDNWWALSTFNLRRCPLPDEAILVWKDNVVRGNAYPGEVQDYIDGTADQLLCQLWPCGENQPCVEPDEVGDVNVCE